MSEESDPLGKLSESIADGAAIDWDRPREVTWGGSISYIFNRAKYPKK